MSVKAQWSVSLQVYNYQVYEIMNEHLCNELRTLTYTTVGLSRVCISSKCIILLADIIRLALLETTTVQKYAIT